MHTYLVNNVLKFSVRLKNILLKMIPLNDNPLLESFKRDIFYKLDIRFDHIFGMEKYFKH